MKKILLSMDDDVFSRLRSAMTAKGLGGAAYGIVDEMFIKLIQAMEKDEAEKHFSFRDPSHKGD